MEDNTPQQQLDEVNKRIERLEKSIEVVNNQLLLDKIDLDLYDNKKTQSQRLRGVLYLNWEKDKKGFNDFKDYYQMETNRIIEHYKSKLE